MPSPTYILGIEFTAGSFTNVVADLRGAHVARSAGGLFNPLSLGELIVTVDNIDGTYSPRNTGSPYFDYMRPDIAVRLQATWSGSTYDIFRGLVDAWEVQPQYEGGRVTTIRARDSFKHLETHVVTTSLFVDTNAASLFRAVFDAASLDTTTHSVDVLNDTIPFAWFRDRDALGAIQEILNAGFYNAYASPSGILRVRSRYWDQAGTTQVSLRATSTSTVGFYEMRYVLSDEQLFNDITVTGIPRKRDTDTRTIAFLVGAPTIAASGSLGFFLSYLDPDTQEPVPADNIVTPVNSTDYRANTQADGSGSDRTSTLSLVGFKAFGETAVASLFNGSGDVVALTHFSIRGQAVQRRAQVSVQLAQSSSQVLYDRHSFSLTNDLIAGQLYLQDYAEFLRLRQSYPVDRLTPVGLKNQFSIQLGTELGDVVHLHEPIVGIDKRFTVLGIEHEIRGDGVGFEHTTRYTVEEHHDFEVLILDNATLGKLDSNRKLGF